MWQGLFSLGRKTFHTRRKQRLKIIWYPSEALWTSLMLNSIGNSLFHSLQRSRALNFIVDMFQTNNTPIYSHGLSYNVARYRHLFWFKVQFLSIAFVSCSVIYLTQLMSNINNRNKLQLMQIFWNVMLYSPHFTLHWKLLVTYTLHPKISNEAGFGHRHPGWSRRRPISLLRSPTSNYRTLAYPFWNLCDKLTSCCVKCPCVAIKSQHS